MQHDANRPDASGRWLINARADLALARATLPQGALYEHLCFHAQQAAEKALKAVLINEKIDFPFTHSIQSLLDLLPDALCADANIHDAVDLTPYAVATRYPGEYEPVSEEEHREAIRIAQAIVDWAGAVLANQK